MKPFIVHPVRSAFRITAAAALAALLSASSASAAEAKDVFTTDEIVWFGLDFSKAKMVGQFTQFGDAGEASGTQMKQKFFPAWNMLVLNEPKNFDLKKAFRKTGIFNDLSVVEKRNAAVDPDKLFTYNEHKIEKSEIEKIIAEYKGGEKKEGIGLVFIVEAFSKPAEMGSFYVTLFDIASHKVLITERLAGRTGGFGLRNYWARSVKEVIQQIDKTSYTSWKTGYGK